MADDIARWLEGLGLGQYAQAFAQNNIELDVVPDLSEDDLKELGLKIGDRRRLQRAVQALSPTRHEPAPTPSPPQPAVSGEAERRQLTLLFCDLVGSTALSARLDPEDMREILRAYQQACAGVIARYDGYVAKFMGDGVYAYFGYPRAHEDDAERAINAGLGIVEAIGALEGDLKVQIRLKVRIGVATGTVAVGDIVGEGASEEANVVGEAPNLAARATVPGHLGVMDQPPNSRRFRKRAVAGPRGDRNRRESVRSRPSFASAPLGLDLADDTGRFPLGGTAHRSRPGAV